MIGMAAWRVLVELEAAVWTGWTPDSGRNETRQMQ